MALRPVFAAMAMMLIAVAAGAVHVGPSGMLIDEHGRTRIYHGLNAVYKVAPFLPSMGAFDPKLSLGPEDVKNLNKWGFNVIRLGSQWEGLFPERGVANMTYLKQLQQMVSLLSQHGISVILDMHQDLMARQFCGEGFPHWAVNVSSVHPPLPFPLPAVMEMFPKDKDGNPVIEKCLEHMFGRYYMAMEVNYAFQNFYENAGNVWQALGDFWELIAKSFKGGNILGYELINEPWPGDVYHNFVDAYQSDKNYLQPLYRYLNGRIRAQDRERLIFFEPSLVDQLHVHAGFTEPPGGPEFANVSVFSYHAYCPLTNDDGEPSTYEFCRLYHDATIELRVNDGKKLNVGGFLTEFGAFPDTKVIDVDIIDVVLDECEDQWQGWTWWQFKAYNDITTASGSMGNMESFYYANGTLQERKVKALARSYAYAIAGTPVKTRFNSKTGELLVSYKVNTAVTAPTEIFLSMEFYYKKGFNWSFTPANAFGTPKAVGVNSWAVPHTQNAINGATVTIHVTAM